MSQTITSIQAKPKPKLLRKLGNNETYQLAMYTLDQYRGTSVSCRYTIPPRMRTPETRTELVYTVEKAIAEVVLKHPVLQVGIVGADSKNPRWIQLHSLDLLNHIRWRNLSAAENFDELSSEVTASEVDGLFPDLQSRPGWRITILRQELTDILEIHFTWNHPHADGISAKIFMQDLFQTLNNQKLQSHKEEGFALTTILLPESSPSLPPPIEDVCKLPVSLGWIIKMAWEEFGPPSLAWTRPSLAKWAPIQLSPYKTQFRAFTVKSDALEKILVCCRQHRTTLTSLLHGLTLVSLASQLDEQAAPGFESGTTVDLRRFMASASARDPSFRPEETMGNYVTIMSHMFEEAYVKEIRSILASKTTSNDTVSLPDELIHKIWSVSTKVRNEIKQKLETGLRNDPVGAMKFVCDWRKQMSDTARRPRQFSWWVTGLGVLDGQPKHIDGTSSPSREDGWVVQRAQFALSAETAAAAIMVSPMTVRGGQLCVGVSWQDCIFDSELGERVTVDLERWLGQIASI